MKTLTNIAKMVLILMLVFILEGILFSTYAKAESASSEAELHLAAHLGVSYALDTILVGFNTKALRMQDKVDAETFAAFTTLFIGLVYKMQQNASGPDMIRASWQNALGVGAAVLTRCMFTYKF